MVEMSILRVAMGVEEAVAILKRLYRVEREVCRALAGRHIWLERWDAKKRTPRHAWEDSLHADALRSRVLEMRYPRRDVDAGLGDGLRDFLATLLRIEGDGPFLAVIYRVVKPALVAAYEQYLSETDALDDAPTERLLQLALAEERRQIEEMAPILNGISDNPAAEAEAERWVLAAWDALHAVGGLSRGEGAMPPASPLLSLPPYRRPAIAARDPRFTPATVHMPRMEGEPDMRSRRVWQGINHANEMWAAEAVGVAMAELADMPWEFYLDGARWAYDEARHSAMGEERLAAWGYELGVDVPCVADHYNAVSHLGTLELLALLHGFETGGPRYKQWLKGACEEHGYLPDAQDCDYDWADEALHLAYGLKWLRHLLGGKSVSPAAIEAKWQEAMAVWNEWIDRQWAENPNQYAAFQSRITALMTDGKPE